jgi:hypothetical protein
MKRWRARIALLAGAAGLLAALPALGQEEEPESLLPPGFGEPQAPLPPPVNQPPSPGQPRPAELPDSPVAEDSSLADLEELPEVPPPPPIELPASARRSPDFVGPLTPSNWGLGPQAYGSADGAFLTSLMRRLDAPVASRWTSILLRRALLSQTAAPSHVSSVDWIAERAWLLLRMGEADAARMLVQSVDVDRFTEPMVMVAVQTALATADPAALCPLIAKGRTTSNEAVWPLAEAMCAALEGEAARAGVLIDQARRRSGAGGIDLTLAEKVIGAGTDTRRAVTVEWEGVSEINTWRFGLASATGLAIPPDVMNAAGPQVRAWQARAPMVPIEQRVAAAQTAASLGVFSSNSLVEMYSLIADSTDPSEIEASVGGRLRRAFASRSMAARMSALKNLWDEAKTDEERHARLILTATPAALILPSADHAGESGNLIAAMLSAGLDTQAVRWSGIVEAMGDDGDRAWALLAISSARPRVALDAGRISDFSGRDDSPDKMRSRMLIAALAGLGRIQPGTAAGLGDDVGLDLRGESRWSRMIHSAARTGQTGTVALLAAVGMQTHDWRGVPPEHLYHIVGALNEAGLGYEARMIAAEALARL